MGLILVVLAVHIEGIQLAQLQGLQPGKVGLVAEHQVTAGNVPGVKLVIGDLAVPLRRRNERLHIFPVLDFSGKEGKLMKQPAFLTSSASTTAAAPLRCSTRTPTVWKMVNGRRW